MNRFHNFNKSLLAFLFAFFLLIGISTIASSEETYVFERMWPTLQQPWYFNAPEGVATDGAGNVYVADTGYHRIQKLTSEGQLISQWGTPGSGDGQFNEPHGIAVDGSGNVYVVDHGNQRIQKFTSNGQFIIKWGNWEQFYYPHGIAVDGSGNVYVADYGNDCIQKFTSNGQFISKWGTSGSGDGEFNWPHGIAVDGSGNVYVADTGNNRIQKFNSNGQFVTKWGTFMGDGMNFMDPSGTAVDGHGNVYVTDRTHAIQKFTAEGQFISQLGSHGSGDGQLEDPDGIALDGSGNIYVADAGNNRIQKFNSEGQFASKWGSYGSDDGQFNWPFGIALDSSGNVYVTDTDNYRIQKFNSEGDFVSKWGNFGFDDGEFYTAYGIAVDGSGNVYVTDWTNDRIQKFNSDGQFVTQWGSYGKGDGQFSFPAGIAVDGSGNVYVVDYGNHRIQKFTSNGQFISKWGSFGGDEGQFSFPWGIAVDGSGNVYVDDLHRIQKFSSDGQFVTQWGSYGKGDGEFNTPHGIAVDGSGKVYVADADNHRIQKFTSEGQFVTKLGAPGSNPGQLFSPNALCLASDSRIYVADTYNNRIQVFKKVLVEDNSKAIVVAGGGAYPGNTLWDATQMSANFAYRTLTYQGFTKETIYYLTSDTQLDLDNNGVADDVDGDATNANLQQAITTWAADADSIVLYLVDHGGDGNFRMSGTETLSSSDLDLWLDQLQQTITGKVTVIYDACESGSFLSSLTPESGTTRFVITSTSPGESAYFVSQGSVSFSNYFWTHIFNGLDIKEAFNLATEALQYTTNYQHPLLDTNGNGVGNESQDHTLAQGTYIGNGTIIHGDAPVIGSVSGAQTISGMNSAVLSAFNITDNDGIARVWAVIRPPDYNQGSSDNPIHGLPSIDLMPSGGDQYEGTYSGFNITGTYHIAIYARDRIGNTAIPKLTTVSVENPLSRKAIIVAGGTQTDGLWPSVEQSTKLVYEALSFQGYSHDDIYLMSPASIPGVTKLAVLSKLSNLEHAITSWALSDTQDVVLYMVGNGSYGTFEINDTETLKATDLDNWLDILQANIPGKVTVIYDACQSGSFLPSLSPPQDKERILVSSSSDNQSAYFISEGDISFSKFFWRRVLNGMNIRDAFIHSKNAILYACQGQTPQMDDNGNGIGNEKPDGQLARNYTIGVGIMLAGNDPVIGSVCAGQTLSDGITSAILWAEDVTTTGNIDRVWAVITPPEYLNEEPGQPVTNLPTVELVDNGSGRYEGTYNDFSTYGNYTIAVFAMDTDGNVSLPKETSVFQEIGPDVFEDDDTFNDANVIIHDYEEAQRHTFHDEGDEDWVKFYGVAGESYEIKTENLGSRCDTVITLYDSSGTTEIATRDDYGYEEGELLSWECPSDGIYYVMVKQPYSTDYGQNTAYDLRVYHPTAGFPGFLKGMVVDALGQGIEGAVIKSDVTNTTTMSLDSGFYLMILPSGTYTIGVEASGYEPQSAGGVIVQAEGHTNQDFVMGAIDSDDDGLDDVTDNCPNIHNPGQEDIDEDGVGDLCDGCPNDPNKTEAGVCGCGVADKDSDGDGTLDCNDGCPNDANKTDPGQCGCGVADTDTDSDGTPDCNDDFPSDPNEWLDTDGDGTGNNADPDDDNDEMPDAWEEEYGLNPLLDDASEDQDKDEYSNLQEYWSGTDPADEGSIPQHPVADAGPDQTVYENETITLDGSNSSDPDDGIASYLWTQTTGTSVTLSDTTASQPNFTAPDVGTGGESLTFELTVTDNGGLQGTDTCIVNVISAVTCGSGWNLISLLKQPEDTDIEKVLESISGKYVSVWAYIDGSWKVYDPLNPGFSDLTTMEAGRGYWINMKEYGALNVNGSIPATTCSLTSGWNLVGYNGSTSQPVSDALESIEGKYISVWAYVDGSWEVYDPNNPGFSDLTTMEPGRGYWINAMEACTWIH